MPAATRPDGPPRALSSPTSVRHLVAAALILLVVVTACTAAGPTPTAAPDGTSILPSPVITQSPTTQPEPDKLPDPGVGPGQCKVVMYTPPTAKDAMPGELCRPKDNQRDVAVIVIHGGSGIGGSYQGMRRWANRYLVEGYVTFLPEYHLFNPGGETPVFPRPEQNIMAAVQYLRGTGLALGIRKDRIVVQGQSAGARVGAVAYTSPDDAWFAGPEIYPDLSDRANGFIGFYHPYDGTMQFADQYFGGPEASRDPLVQQRLERADSLARAVNATGPALFITGSEDWSVITVQQAAFADALHKRQYAATSLVIKGGGHGFDEGGERLSKLGEESAVETLKWLNENFPQLPSRDPQNVEADINTAHLHRRSADDLSAETRAEWRLRQHEAGFGFAQARVGVRFEDHVAHDCGASDHRGAVAGVDGPGVDPTDDDADHDGRPAAPDTGPHDVRAQAGDHAPTSAADHTPHHRRRNADHHGPALIGATSRVAT